MLSHSISYKHIKITTASIKKSTKVIQDATAGNFEKRLLNNHTGGELSELAWNINDLLHHKDEIKTNFIEIEKASSKLFKIMDNMLIDEAEYQATNAREEEIELWE